MIMVMKLASRSLGNTYASCIRISTLGVSWDYLTGSGHLPMGPQWDLIDDCHEHRLLPRALFSTTWDRICSMLRTSLELPLMESWLNCVSFDFSTGGL